MSEKDNEQAIRSRGYVVQSLFSLSVYMRGAKLFHSMVSSDLENDHKSTTIIETLTRIRVSME